MFLIPKTRICDTAWVSMTTVLKTILIIQEIHAILPAFHKECWEALYRATQIFIKAASLALNTTDIFHSAITSA